MRSNAENKKRTLLAIDQFKTELNDVIVWLTDVEKRLKMGNLDAEEVKVSIYVFLAHLCKGTKELMSFVFMV